MTRKGRPTDGKWRDTGVTYYEDGKTLRKYERETTVWDRVRIFLIGVFFTAFPFLIQAVFDADHEWPLAGTIVFVLLGLLTMRGAFSPQLRIHMGREVD